MPSCSSSSNINSSLVSLSTTANGSRLVVTIPKVTGITFGNVIRYDVPTSGYTASRANNASNSEVFGIVENLDASGNNFNVVIYGSINYSGQLFDMGSAGGCGGNDIYFLSGTTSGALQNLAPTDLSHIIKPVYQVSPHGSYSGVVVNYLGYRIGGEVEAVSDDRKGIGEIKTYIGSNAQFDPGFLDASISHLLPITEYPDFYSQVGTIYGYIEEIEIPNTQAFNGISEGLVVRQNGVSVGRVDSVVTTTKIRIRKNASTSLINLNQQIVIETTPNASPYTPVTTAIYGVRTPRVVSTSFPAISGRTDTNSDDTGVNQFFKIGIKVKPLGVNVNIPNVVTVPTLNATTIAYGTSVTDLEGKISSIESRLDTGGL